MAKKKAKQPNSEIKRFFSKRASFAIHPPTNHLPVERQGKTVYVEDGLGEIRFKGGVYTTKSEDVYDFLKEHASYGVDFWELGDEPEQAATSRGKSRAVDNPRTGPVTAQQAGAPEPSIAEKVQRVEEAARVKLDDPQAAQQIEASNGIEGVKDTGNGSGAGDAESEGKPLLGVSNKNDAIEKLHKAGVNTSDLSSKTTVDEIRAFAKESGYYFPDW